MCCSGADAAEVSDIDILLSADRVPHAAAQQSQSVQLPGITPLHLRRRTSRTFISSLSEMHTPKKQLSIY